jgi:SAM-dependent methyltransferase
MPANEAEWNQRYLDRETPWDSGEPSRELQRLLQEGLIPPCRMLELGCGTGTNALYLARQGFEVTALDLAPNAIEQARAKAAQAGLPVRFLQADALRLPDLGPPFPFVFDRGVYHHLRTVDLDRFRASLKRVSAPGGLYLTLAGNANERGAPSEGPPRVHAHEICLELGPLFDLVQLREYRFDGVRIQGQLVSPLAWSVLLRRREDTA